MEGERWNDRGTQSRARHRVGERGREKRRWGEREWDRPVRKAARKTREGERKDSDDGRGDSGEVRDHVGGARKF